MILVDANVPMYLVGAEHPLKHRATALLESLIHRRERLVTDAEVIQEILHRYSSLNRRDAIQPAVDSLLALADEVLPVTRVDVLRAKDLLLAYATLSARDAVHVAVMQSHGMGRILSFDAGYDHVPGIERLH